MLLNIDVSNLFSSDFFDSSRVCRGGADYAGINFHHNILNKKGLHMNEIISPQFNNYPPQNFMKNYREKEKFVHLTMDGFRLLYYIQTLFYEDIICSYQKGIAGVIIKKSDHTLDLVNTN
ncbi:MAG: hypothetical protein GY730_11905 [bacterium]|nr:hypothetical protein [bacterium]